MKTRLSNPYLARLICPVVLASAAIPAFAETLYWNGVNDGATSWENILNWSTDPDATSPNPAANEWPKSDDDAVFNISTEITDQTIHLNSTAQAVNSLTFDSTGTTAIDNEAIPSATATSLSLGSGGLTVGSGAGAVSIGGGGSVAVNGATVALTTSATVTHNGASSLNFGKSLTTGTSLGAITLTLAGTGITEYAQGIDQATDTQLSLVVDGGRHYFRAPSTLTNMTINGGEILSRGSSQFDSVVNTINFNGGAWASVQSARSYANDFAVGGDIQLGSSGIPTIGNIVAVATFGSTFGGTFDLTGGNRTITTIGANTLSGEISNGSLTVGAGSTGTLTLSGINIYDGGTTISGGTLVVSSADNLGDAASDLVFDGGTLRVTGTSLTSLADLGRTNPVVFNAGKTVGLDVADALNTFTVGQVLNQTTGGFTKLGAGTAILDQANTYTGTTTLNGGTLEVTQAQNLTGGLTFGATLGSTVVSNLNLDNASATFAGPMVVQTNSTATPNNAITIGSGEKLTINNNVSFSGGNARSRLSVSGAGGWDVIASDGTFASLGTLNGSDMIVNMDGLAEFNANLRTGGSGSDGGLFRVGAAGTSGTNGRNHTTSLATNSTISADSVDISMLGGAVGLATLSLGNGTQIINSDSITMGTGSASRGESTISFRTTDGTLKIRGTDGGNATRSNLTMLTALNTGGVRTSTFDVTGHAADLLFDTVKIYDHTNTTTNSATNTYTATFSFDQGTLDATTFQIGTKSGGSFNNPGIAIANIGSSANLTNSATLGTLNMGVLSTGDAITANSILDSTLNITGTATTVNFGTMSMGNSTSAGVDAESVSAVNISGGSVTGTGGINMLDALTAGTATSTLTVSGGSLSVGTGGVSATNGIYRTAATGTTTLILNGGSLNLNGNAIGGAGANAITTQFESGTLSNVGEINGGGGLTKTTSGTLTLTGTNTYTGATAVNEGTLSMSSPSLADASAVTIATGAVLNLTHSSTDTVASLTLGATTYLTGTFNSGNSGGLITGTGQITVNAVATPYDTWVALYQPGFTNNLPTQDQDSDGLTNQEEFAFGLNPKSGSSVNPITTGLDTATGNFSFTRNASSGLTYKVWSSSDLAVWTERTGATQTPVGTPDGFGTQTVDVTTLGATPVGGKLFVRVTAE